MIKPDRRKGILERIFAWISTLDYSASDYVFDRISVLEGEVNRLKQDVERLEEKPPSY